MPKPFLTPSHTSEERQCRTLYTPTNKEWLGVFNSALLEMLNPYNWEQVNNTDLSIEDSIAIVHEILDEYFNTLECAPDGVCVQPNGARVLRLNRFGHIQQMNNGEWVEPTDEYAIPPTPPRAEPTAVERRCAAAANAANVLSQLYEQVVDAVQDGLTEAEILEQLIAIALTLLGTAIAAALGALIALVGALLAAFIEIAQFITMDVWDVDFNDLLICALNECASDSGDVVTFDFQCVKDKLAEAVELTDDNALDQLRLFGQISFILDVIGVDGLNLAGATTAITDANCDDCGGWCYTWDIENDGFGGWSVYAGAQNSQFVYLTRSFTSVEVTYVQVEYTTGGVGVGGTSAYAIWTSNPPAIGTRIAIVAPVGGLLFIDWHGSQVMNTLLVGCNSDDTGAEWFIRTITVGGNGDNPFGTTNCDD